MSYDIINETVVNKIINKKVISLSKVKKEEDKDFNDENINIRDNCNKEKIKEAFIEKINDEVNKIEDEKFLIDNV